MNVIKQCSLFSHPAHAQRPYYGSTCSSLCAENFAVQRREREEKRDILESLQGAGRPWPRKRLAGKGGAL